MKDGGEEVKKGSEGMYLLFAPQCPSMISLVWRRIASFIAFSCFSPFLDVS